MAPTLDAEIVANKFLIFSNWLLRRILPRSKRFHIKYVAEATYRRHIMDRLQWQ